MAMQKPATSMPYDPAPRSEWDDVVAAPDVRADQQLVQRPPMANSHGDRIYDGPVARMIALRNGQIAWHSIPDPNRPTAPTKETKP